MVRAKFIVEVVTESLQGKTIKLSPVTSGSEENKTFFKWTPFGSIEIGTINVKEYYVDFSAAE